MLVTPFSFLPQPVQNATKYGNMTQDHVMHMLLVSGTQPVTLPTHPGFPRRESLLEGLHHSGLTGDVQDRLTGSVNECQCNPSMS